MNWWAGFFDFFSGDNYNKKHIFSSICAQNSAACQCAMAGKLILTFPLPCLFVNFPFCTQLPSAFPNHQVNWSRPTCMLDSLYKCFMSLAAKTCDGSQREPTCALGSSIIPQELGELSQFLFFFFFCSVFKIVQVLQCGNYSQGNGRDLTFPLVRNS